jgi:N-acetylmuramoyl-L-alanine amidase
MAKVYLSPAAHTTDNATKCPVKCGENVHCNQYMDILEARLLELGFDVKRGSKTAVGGDELQRRVAEANKWKADIYYVAHTNAGGGRYSLTLHYPNIGSEAKAKIFTKYRKCVSSHKTRSRNDLYEINATAMPCIYDELFFHDNAEDCKWFHSGGMEKLAEETAQALCEVCGVKYTPKTEKTASLYRVQVGAYAVKENAENMLEKLKKAGFDGYIVEVKR